MPFYLNAASQQLEAAIPTYQTRVLSEAPTSSRDSEEQDKAWQNALSHILSFATAAARRPAGKAYLKTETMEGTRVTPLTFLTNFAFFYGQIRAVDEEQWNDNVDEFIADDDEELPASTLRTASLDLIGSFVNTFGEALMLRCVMQALQLFQPQDGAEKWKANESILNHLTHLSSELASHTAASKTSGSESIINLEEVFEQIVMPSLQDEGARTCQSRPWLIMTSSKNTSCCRAEL